MEISEFIKKKAELEVTILKEIHSAVEKFRNETGYSPCNIYINMRGIPTFDGSPAQYIVANVDVDIPLETK